MRATPSAILLCLALALLPQPVVAQLKPPPAGITKPGYYRNEFFGFSLVFPTSWTVVQQRTPNQFQQEGGEVLEREGVLRREQVKADQSNTHNLFAAANARKEKNGRNPQILIIAEGIHKGAPFETAEGYLAHTLKLFENIRSPKTAIVTPPHEVTVGGRKLWRADLSRAGVRQSYFSMISRSFAVSIITTGGDADHLAEANGIAMRILFDEAK